MYNILIQKHRLNLASLEKSKRPLDEFIENRYSRIKKINRFIANREKIFQGHVSQLTTVYEKNAKKSKMSVHFPKELEKLMKDQYLENYKNSEEESLKYIKSHRYRYFLDWQAMIYLAKKRYDGELLEEQMETVTITEYKKQKITNMIPKTVGRKSAKFLMAQIALITSISGK